MYELGGVMTTQEEKQVPFYPPVMTLTDDQVDIDFVSLDNGYIITNKVSKEDPFTDNTIPTVFIDSKVLIESYYIMEYKAKSKDEVCMFYLLNKVSSKYPLFRAYGYYITDQEVTSVEVEADGADNRRYFKWLQENYPKQFTINLHRKLLPVHSHHSMGSFWSGTDLKQQNSPGDMGFCDDYRMFGVYTSKEKLKMSYVQYFPVYNRIEDINIGIKVSTSGDSMTLTEERKKELREIVDSLVKAKKSVTVYNVNNWVSPLNVTPVTQTRTRDYSSYWDTQPTGTPPNKYKLVGFIETITEHMTKFMDVIKASIELEPDVMDHFSDLIYLGLTENIPNIVISKEEEKKLRECCNILVNYTFNEYPIDSSDNKDSNFDILFCELVDRINEWIDDEESAIYKLNRKFAGKNLNMIMAEIDDIIFEDTIQEVTQ